MTLFPQPAPDRQPRTIQPGAVHLPGWLDHAQQRALVDAFHIWAGGPVPIRAATTGGGRRMSVRTVCLGWHWAPYRYSRTADDVNGARVLELPGWLVDLGRAVLTDAYDQVAAQRYRPDTALVNFYDASASMGMHQDRDEITDDPVVSLSIGDTCRFRLGNTHTRNKPYTDLDLASGDALVLGRESRFAFHGIPKVYPGTADPDCGLPTGRINITMRTTGLSGLAPGGHP